VALRLLVDKSLLEAFALSSGEALSTRVNPPASWGPRGEGGGGWQLHVRVLRGRVALAQCKLWAMASCWEGEA
jgi:hypothetical protein